MADFGTYTALAGRKDWSQVRADRQNELVYIKQMQADLQQRIQNEAQAREGVVSYMNQINQASVLEQDLGRVKGVEAEARKKIVEGLKAAGNDYNKFLLGNGAATLQEYYNTVMKSDEMQAAVNNKLVYAQSMLDNYMGRKARPVNITLPDGTQKQVSMSEQMKMFDEGTITKMNYAGSVQPTDLIKIQQAIQQTFGKNPYKRQQANREDIYEYALRFGAEDWEANQLADAYEAGVVEGAETPIYYNYKEPPKADATSELLKMMNRKMLENPYRVYDDAAAGKYATQIVAYEDKEQTKPLKDLQGNQFAVAITQFSNDAMRTDFANSSGIRIIGEGDEKKKVFLGTAYSAKNLQPIDISAADIVDIQELTNVIYADDAEKAKQQGIPYYGTPMVKVKVSFGDSSGNSWLRGDDRAAQDAGVWDNDWWRPNVFAKEDASAEQKGNFRKEDGAVVGEMLIPVNMSDLNKAMNNASVSEFNDYDDILKLKDYSMYFGLGNTE